MPVRNAAPWSLICLYESVNGLSPVSLWLIKAVLAVSGMHCSNPEAPWITSGLHRESPLSGRPSPGVHPQPSIFRNSECSKSLWNIQAMISNYTRLERDQLWINWNTKPFLLPAHRGYTEAFPAPCPWGVIPKPSLLPAHERLYKSLSCSLPMKGYPKAIPVPGLVGLYQCLSFSLWEWEHIAHPQRSFLL